MRSYIEQSLKDKERVILALRVYEANRSRYVTHTYITHSLTHSLTAVVTYRIRMKVFSQSLHIVTQGTLNTLNIIKETGSKLRKIRQVRFVGPPFKLEIPEIALP